MFRKLPFRRASGRLPIPRKLLLEVLEERCTPATITTASVDLTAPEQLMLQMVNRARANPTAEAALYQIGLNDGLPAGTISSAPEAPLAPTADLQTVAEQHSADMIANNYFSHTGLDGSTPQSRIAATGYSGDATGENIAYITAQNNTPAEAAPQLEGNLFQSAGHRENILSPNYNEIGIGIANQVLGPQDYQQVDVTEDFGGRPNVVYLTGVLYTDTAHTGFYAIGEGLTGVTVTATNTANGQSYATTSNSAGGYEIALPSGTYTVTILGVSGAVTIGSTNSEVDYQTNALLGVTAIATPSPPPPPPPTTTSATTSVPDQIGVFRNGTWILDSAHTETYNAADTTYAFGTTGDKPIVGDWNGDGKDDIGLFRNVNGVGEFVLDTSETGVFTASDPVFFFGLGTDTPIVGDWTGSGKDQVGLFRNDNGVGEFVLDPYGHHVYDSTSIVFHYGLGTDRPVIGDWNGDGTDKVGIYRNNGSGVDLFALDTDGDHVFNARSTVFQFGLASDTVLIGDWNGDGKAKVGVFRNTGTNAAGLWALDYNGTLVFNNSDPVFYFGLATDIPIVGKW